MRRGSGDLHRKLPVLVIGILLLAAAVAWTDHREYTGILKQGYEREPVGGNTREETIYYRVDGGARRSLTLEIEPETLSEPEAMDRLEEAKEAWEQTYLGENPSADAVSKSLKLPKSLLDGLVSVDYLPDPLTVMEEDGSLCTAEIPVDGCLVTLTSTFGCEGFELVDVRTLHVMPPAADDPAGMDAAVAGAFQKSEAASRTAHRVQLPDEVAGHGIRWEPAYAGNGLLVLLLGMAVLAALPIRAAEQKRQRQKEREARLLYEYPQVVDQMCLLLGSGMTIRKAWERMAATWQRQKGRGRTDIRLAAEEMLLTDREMREGRSERECYERFAARIGLLPYRRFVSILTQNLLKGTEDIRRLLSEEAGQALELRKTAARRLGEEAGTKLLGPMILMFFLILAVVVFPALQLTNIW